MQNGSNSNQNNLNQNQPDPIPLLSGLNFQKALSLAQGDPGRFTSSPVSNQFGQLYNIQSIVNNMDGQGNARGSIPDVCAQEICVRSMLDHILAKNDDESRLNMKKQWYGTLFAYILSPLFLFAQPELRWEQISLSDLANQSNQFSMELHKSIRRKEAASVSGQQPASEQVLTERKWHFLTLLNSAIPTPLLEYGSLPYPVPSASLDQIPALPNFIPWVNENEQYADPLLKLSQEALLYIDRWLNKQLKVLPDEDKLMKEAYHVVRGDVQARLRTFNHSAAFLDVEERLLQALLLRDLVDTGIIIFRLDDKRSKESYAEAVASAPIDKADMRSWDEIIAAFPYGIMLRDKFVGFLDETRLFWLVSPGYLRDSDIYRKMDEMLDKALRDPAILHAYRSKLALMPMSTFQLSDALRKKCKLEKKEYSPVQQIAVCPTPGKLESCDVALLDPPFQTISRLCGYRHDSLDIFTPVLQVYRGVNTPLNSHSSYAKWNEIKLSTHMGEDGKVKDQALLPLTTIGATIIRNSEMLHYVPSVTLVEDPQQKSITATLSVSINSIQYQWTHTYPQEKIINGDNETLPSIGFWPDGASSAGDTPWQGYYTYINFNESKAFRNSSFVLYDSAGERITSAWAPPVRLTDPSGGMHFAWQTQATEQRPSFCVLEHDGLGTGCILFEQPALFRPYERDVILAIDFGTTSTTGAVLMDPKDPQSVIVPMFSGSVIHWVLNKLLGQSWSLEQFIADRFNCKSSKTDATSFFTSIARFPTTGGTTPASKTPHFGNSLYQDGHIYYYGDSFFSDNKMGNTRYFSLKLQNIKQTDSLYGSNTSMFLQQVIETYLLYCRKKGAHVTEIRFAYPLAFSKDERENIQKQMETLVEAAVNKSGSSHCSVRFTSESQAVSAYFSQKPGLQRSLEKQGVVALDIGGGTADFSYCRKNEQHVLCCCYSNKLAGHAILGEYIYQYKALTGNEKKQDALNWFFDGCEEIAKTKMEEEQRAIKAFETALDIKKAPGAEKAIDKDQFIFILERFISLHPELYVEIVQTKHFQEAYTLIMLDLTLLLWFGYLLGTTSLPSNSYTPADAQNGSQQKTSISIHLGGNGAHMYRMLTAEDLKTVEALIPDRNDTDMEIHINDKRYRKREVAEGLLQASNLIFEDSSMVEAGKKLTPPEMWERFASICERFAQEFSGRSDRVIDYLNLIKNDPHKHTQEQFLEKVTNLSDLCQFISDFHVIMIEHLFTQK